MKITSLIENTSGCGSVEVEHGLSLYIETGDHNILFDMGQTELFYQNATALGIDLTKVDVAVLSHGHYDHGGGLKKFLEINNIAPVYVHKDAFLPHYNGTDKYIGLDASLKDDPRIIFTDGEYHISESLTLFSCNGFERKHPLLSSGLYEKVGDDFIDDDFRHEQYLLIEQGSKRVLISGCSHKGILDIAHWFSPDILIGGFHYSKLEPGGFLECAAKELAGYMAEFYTCHCTGTLQFEFMKKFMPSLKYLSCGQSVVI